MPPLAGEERLVTVYTDIHYYFAPPTLRPVLHRFDKASYFYIYYNASTGLSRVEVANNPGSPEQDAFNGYLDRCRIINSHKFPTLMTLVVDGAASNASSPSSRQHHDPEVWRLASADPRDTGKSKYRLHTLDIYFWAQEDARLVIENLKQLLQPDQLDVVELEPEYEQEHLQEPAGDSRHEAVSPVVQNLENVAISDPAYQNGQTRNSQNQAHQAINLPPPPPPPPATSQAAQTNAPPLSAPQPNTQTERPQQFAPMAYNPAAPAAPEPIAHREDTPPPPEDGHGTGLAAAARHDHLSYAPSQSSAQPYQIGQPPSQPYQPGQPEQPFHASQAHARPWTGAPPTVTSPYQLSSATSQTYTNNPHAQSPTSSTHRNSTAAAHYTPDPYASIYSPSATTTAPVTTPGSQFYSTLPPPASSTSPHKPLQHVQPQYADYLSAAAAQEQQQYAHFNYGAAQQQGMLKPGGGGGSQYDVHSQVYRPTESEATAHAHRMGHGKRHSSSAQGKESRVEKGEKKVSGWMKKLESKVGL